MGSELEEFLTREHARQTKPCATCALGPHVTKDIDHWLELKIAGKTSSSVMALYRFLAANRNYTLGKDSLRKHLSVCRPAEYEKALHGG